jgi:hypothetical protein
LNKRSKKSEPALAWATKWDSGSDFLLQHSFVQMFFIPDPEKSIELRNLSAVTSYFNLRLFPAGLALACAWQAGSFVIHSR